MPASNEWQHFDRFDGRKQSWRTYEENLVSYAEGITDDSGCNLSQTLFDTDTVCAACVDAVNRYRPPPAVLRSFV